MMLIKVANLLNLLAIQQKEVEPSSLAAFLSPPQPASQQIPSIYA